MKFGRIIPLFIAGAALLLSGCSAPAGDARKEIRVWTTDGTREITQTKLDQWLAGKSEWNSRYTIKVSTMGTGEVVTQFLTDVEEAADVFSFAQDQLSRLVAVDALSAPGGQFLECIISDNDAGSVKAASQDGKIYAYPETSDNGYFMYYDKSVVTDPSTLQGVLDQCAASGKKFYYDVNNGWYNIAFFYGTGCECSYTCDNDGMFTGAVCDFDSDAGMKAFKALLAMTAHPAFEQSTGADAPLFDPDGGDAGAIVSLSFDSAVVRKNLGENYAATKLPTFEVDGETFHMSGFKGYKLIGVKPHSDDDTTTFCHLIANYLSGEEMQLARYDADGWGPSNLKAQQADRVKNDIALTALNEQFEYCKDQGQFPNVYWDLTKAFGMDINAGKYDNADETKMRAALADLTHDILAAR